MGTKVTGAVSYDSLYPHKTLRDAIVFEQPVGGIKYLRLTLPGKAVDEDGELRFQIPKEMINAE
jgi:hypothetical protein